jgi:hypothetical protein
MLDRPPVDAESVGEFVAEHGLVEAAQHSLVSLEVAGVEREPPAVVGLHLGRDDAVRVDLRVVGPRRRLTERSDRQSL